MWKYVIKLHLPFNNTFQGLTKAVQLVEACTGSLLHNLRKDIY